MGIGTAIGIFSLMILTLGLSVYQLITLQRMLVKVKTKLSQNSVALRMVYKSVRQLEQKIQAQSKRLSEIEQSSQSVFFEPQQSIEHDYDRAKKVIKNRPQKGVGDLHVGDMTSEEIELLANLMRPELME